MSNIFKNDELSFKYPNNWKLLEADDIENCVAVLDCDSKFSRVMIFKYPQDCLWNILRMQLKTFQGKRA